MTEEQLAAAAADAQAYEDVAAALKVIGGKWKALLLWKICDGKVRFNELRRLIPDASQKMLSQHLKELERDRLIHREVFPETPPRVEYSLTEYGRSLEPVFAALGEWGKVHRRIERK